MIFKITTEAEWSDACRAGQFTGSADDKRDGFIHLSAAHQVQATAAKYFANKDGLLLVCFDEGSLGAYLKWEASRGGDLFPHLYAPLPPAAALWSVPVPLDKNGLPILPRDLA